MGDILIIHVEVIALPRQPEKIIQYLEKPTKYLIINSFHCLLRIIYSSRKRLEYSKMRQILPESQGLSRF